MPAEFPDSDMISKGALSFDAEKLLGVGGFGRVCQGKYNGADVAVKVFGAVSVNSWEELKTIFMQEVNVNKDLAHPSIVSFLGYRIDEQVQSCCLVMEFLRFGTLQSLLQNRIKYPDQEFLWYQRLMLAYDISSGLAYLHEKNIRHADLKPLNVLLSQAVFSGHEILFRAKLADFGVSIRLEQQSQHTQKTQGVGGFRVGTLVWMAPEILGGVKTALHVSRKSDIYSLALVLWSLQTREMPYESASWKEVDPVVFAVSVASDQDARPQMPELSPALLWYAELIRACWMQDPDARPHAHEVEQCFKDKIAEVPAAELTRARQYASNASMRLFAPPQESVDRLLQTIAEGRQGDAEAILCVNLSLLLQKGTARDYSQRSFEHVTAFQLAAWLLDITMLRMLMSYLADATAAEVKMQLDEFGTDNHYDCTALLQSYQEYIEGYDEWDVIQRKAYWCAQVGGEQLKLPAHMASEFFRADCAFDPLPDFNVVEALPRRLHGHQQRFFYSGVHSQEVLPADGFQLGDDFAWIRGDLPVCMAIASCCQPVDNSNTGCIHAEVIKHYVSADAMALHQLYVTRLEQRRVIYEELCGRLENHSFSVGACKQ